MSSQKNQQFAMYFLSCPQILAVTGERTNMSTRCFILDTRPGFTESKFPPENFFLDTDLKLVTLHFFVFLLTHQNIVTNLGLEKCTSFLVLFLLSPFAS